MSSGQKRPALDDTTNRRRSSRPRKERDRFHQEVLVNRKEVEFRVDARRGLHQPGEHIISDEQKQKLNKESEGLKLFRDSLQPEGWRYKPRKSCDEGWVYVAPGVTMKKEIPNVNMFASRLDIYEQYEKDGHSMDEIIRRSKEAEAESDSDRSGNHMAGVARAPAAVARGNAAAAATTTGSATNRTSSNVATPTAATRFNNAVAAPAIFSTNATNNRSNHQEAVTAAAPVVAMAAAKQEDSTIDLSTGTPPQLAQPMTIPQRVRKLEEFYGLAAANISLNVRERIEKLEEDLNIAVNGTLRLYQRVERLEEEKRE